MEVLAYGNRLRSERDRRRFRRKVARARRIARLEASGTREESPFCRCPVGFGDGEPEVFRRVPRGAGGEKRYFDLYREDLDERDYAVLSNADLVFKDSKRFHPTALFNRDDITQEAFLAMLEAYDSYDSTKAKFSTHAVNTMRFALHKALRKNTYHVEVPEDIYRLEAKASKIRNKLRMELQREPTDLDVAAKLPTTYNKRKIDAGVVSWLRGLRQYPAPIDPAEAGDDETPYKHCSHFGVETPELIRRINAHWKRRRESRSGMRAELRKAA